jgi:hypothetical protein
LLGFAKDVWATAIALKIPANVPELSDDMLRYAMAAMGAGSPRDAQRFRDFWRFASEAAEDQDAP